MEVTDAYQEYVERRREAGSAVKARKCFISHGWVVESVEHDDKEVA